MKKSADKLCLGSKRVVESRSVDVCPRQPFLLHRFNHLCEFLLKFAVAIAELSRSLSNRIVDVGSERMVGIACIHFVAPGLNTNKRRSET